MGSGRGDLGLLSSEPPRSPRGIGERPEAEDVVLDVVELEDDGNASGLPEQTPT